MDNLHQIARLLGGQVFGGAILCPGPRHSVRDRSLAVRLDPRAPDGFVCFSHAGDNWRDCRDYVREKLGLPEWQPGDGRQRAVPEDKAMKWDMATVAEESDVIPRFTDDELTRIENARRLWDEGVDPRGTLAEVYLREMRRLELPDAFAGAVLRFHGECPWRAEDTGKTINVPALIAPFRLIDGDEITGIHRIALNSDGTKIGRRMLGVVARAAIKLDQIKGATLTIGEGIETCMAARELGHAPAWALGSAGAISFFPLIRAVKTLIVLGERDAANAHAVMICKQRWQRAGRRVRVATPRAPLNDMNDVLIAKKAQSA